jgi:hypothetical protein
VTRDLTFDLAYSYTWMRDQTIVVGPGNPDQTKLITLIPGVFNTWGGNYASHSQAVSLGLRYAFAPPPPPPPPNLITKAK